jgi:hypothetical protein
MAPILARSIGIIYPAIDDEQLRSLLMSLKAVTCVTPDAVVISDNIPLPAEIVTLCNILQPWCTEWLFEEQVCILYRNRMK